MSFILGWLLFISFVYTCYALYKIFKTRTSNGFERKWVKRLIVSIVLVIIFFFGYGAVPSTSNNTQNNSHVTHKAHEAETYLSIRPSNDHNKGNATFNQNGQATFNVYVHKGTKVYFVNKKHFISYNHYDNNKLNKLSPSHYQIIMKCNLKNNVGDYCNSTSIAAKSKKHKILFTDIYGKYNSNERNQYKAKKRQQHERAVAKAKARKAAEAKRKEEAKAKFLKKYPPIQQALGTTNLNGVDDTKLIETDASATGDVLDFAHGEPGKENVLIRLNNSNQLIMAQVSRHKANSNTIEKDEEITVYGGQLTKGSITDMIVSEGISSDYYSDKAIFMSDPVKISTNSNVIYHGSHPSEMN